MFTYIVGVRYIIILLKKKTTPPAWRLISLRSNNILYRHTTVYNFFANIYGVRAWYRVESNIRCMHNNTSRRAAI